MNYRLRPAASIGPRLFDPTPRVYTPLIYDINIAPNQPNKKYHKLSHTKI